jgi:hypothetical protein
MTIYQLLFCSQNMYYMCNLNQNVSLFKFGAFGKCWNAEYFRHCNQECDILVYKYFFSKYAIKSIHKIGVRVQFVLTRTHAIVKAINCIYMYI